MIRGNARPQRKLLSRLLLFVVGLLFLLLAQRGVEGVQGMLNRNVYEQRTLDSSSDVVATDYYVSPSGDDANAGTSRATAWRTLSKVNRSTFAPSDRICVNSIGLH